MMGLRPKPHPAARLRPSERSRYSPSGIAGARVRILVRNRTGYVTSDLRSFLERGFQAMRMRGSFEVDVVPSPIYSRGCAEVGGRRMVIAIAAPSRFSLRRLARLFEHEAAHLKGLDHDRMNEKLLYSLGPTPEWARGCGFRYKKASGVRRQASDRRAREKP